VKPIKPTTLTWTFRGGETYAANEWSASPTEKWSYAVALKCDEEGKVSFLASRLSTNDGMIVNDIGDLEQEFGTMPEAKAMVERWHAERYLDNDDEFDKYGGNTGNTEQFETEQWSGQFKCQRCGKPITDSYKIQGILHHGCELQCETCENDP
jgi:hypothetical protein